MARQDQNHVAIQIESMLAEAQPSFFTKECSIYKVPPEIRRSNEAAYTSKVVSIGPFHHGRSEELGNMEGHKQIYCKEFIKRSEMRLENLVSFIQDLEPRIRQSYSNIISFSAEELVMVILVDSGFIIELFLRHCHGKLADDDLFSLSPWLMEGIRLDLLLLENQLPFFVLEELYNKAFASSKRDNDPSFLDLSLDYFKGGIGQNFPPRGCNSSIGIVHFTDLLRLSILQPFDKRPPREAETLRFLTSATKLKDAGLRFEPEKNESCYCLLDLKFSGNRIKIPAIKVDGRTEIMLRNMVALEQCYCPGESYISDYVQVLQFLMNTDKDVDFLIEKGIINNRLEDSKEVVKMFKGICRNVLLLSGFNTSYLRMCKDLNAYSRDPYNRFMAFYRRAYGDIGSPWLTFGLTLYGLIFTIIQTWCSLKQVKQS